MYSGTEGVVIRHAEPKRTGGNTVYNEKTKPPEIRRDNHPKRQKNAKSSISDKPKLNLKDTWQVKVISLLLFIFAGMMFVALLSYTHKDEVTAQISIKDFWGIITGNAVAIAKMNSTYNWLGIAGAVLANFLYSSTLGYVMILLPLIILMWAKDIFKKNIVHDRTIKVTITYFVFGMLFSATVGTFQHFGWFPELARQWYGTVGEFTARSVVGLLGKIPALSLFIAGMALTVYITYRIALKEVFTLITPYLVPVSSRIFPFFKKTSDGLEEKVEDLNQMIDSRFLNNINPEIIHGKTNDTGLYDNVTDENPVVNDSEEPVRIIRRNLNFDTNKQPAFEQDMSPNFFGSQFNNISNVRTFDGHKTEVQNKLEKKSNDDINYAHHISRDFINRLDKNVNETDPIYESSRYGIPRDKNSVPDILAQLKKEITQRALTAEDKTEELPKTSLTIDVQSQRDEDEKVEKNESVYPISTSVLDENINYQPPSFNLLAYEEEKAHIDDDELKLNARLLQEKLETFKISIENLSVTPGPVVTLYEFVPAPGIKISKIESYADDIAMALKARGIRIQAPIPGKGTIGIEIPNHKPSIVRFGSIVKSVKFQQSEYKLPLALGKTISGEVFITDLARMPHLLIAGATGAGKSIGINTIIASLIYKLHPKNLKFVIIDPKKVELRQYEALENHFLAVSPDIDSTIITSPEDAVIALKAICSEMDKRYDILADVGQRNIFEYNKKAAEGKLFSGNGIAHKEMPFIIVVIDELADLMLTSGKEVEAPLIRLAQLARGVGIHLVVATQRPSVDVITGIIKANFPSRISYTVATKIDSKTILDMSGAEALIGNGDMLFFPSGSPMPIRIQNAYLSTDEVEAVCKFIGNQKGYSQPYMLPSLTDKSQREGIADIEDRDPLFEEAARLVIRHQQGSISMLQRRLKIGFARAGKIIDELEMAGVVGPSDGSKARTVRMESESDLEYILN